MQYELLHFGTDNFGSHTRLILIIGLLCAIRYMVLAEKAGTFANNGGVTSSPNKNNWTPAVANFVGFQVAQLYPSLWYSKMFTQRDHDESVITVTESEI
jgi:hypothetical protein